MDEIDVDGQKRLDLTIRLHQVVGNFMKENEFVQIDRASFKILMDSLMSLIFQTCHKVGMPSKTFNFWMRDWKKAYKAVCEHIKDLEKVPDQLKELDDKIKSIFENARG